jgi:uncharacterized protein (TIGR02246 family)
MFANTTVQSQATTEINELMERLADAWNRHDPADYAACFTPDASYTTWVGTRYLGRQDIADSHRATWEKFLKGTRMTAVITGIHLYGPDVAVVTAHGDVAKGRGEAKPEGKEITFTAVRQDGSWMFASYQNTKRKRIMEALSFKYAPETAPRRQQ